MSRLENLIKYLPIALLVAYVLLSAANFWTSGERQLIDFFDDDAYYYFKIARNVVDQGRLTFDGQTITNGFHPLWLIVLIPFFVIWNDPVFVLRAIGTFSVVLTGFTGYLGLRYIFRYSLLSYTLAAALILTTMIGFGNTGMEITILLPLMIVALLLLERASLWHSAPQTREIALIGLILSMAQVARLDAVFLNLVVLLFAVVINRPARNRTAVVALGLFPFLTGTWYLLINYAVFGQIVPTSGLAKSMPNNARLFNDKFFQQLISPNNPVDGMLWLVFAGMFVFSVGYLAILLFIKLRSRRSRLAESNYVPAIVASFFIVFAAYHLFRTSWVLWRWYAYPVLPMSIFVIPHISEQVLQRLQAYEIFRLPLRGITAVIVTLVFVRIAMIGIGWGNWAKSLGPSFKYDNFLAAEVLNIELPSPAIVAMGDRAGSFAYFFAGDVLQLEGLVGDYKLLRAIETNSLMDYMSEFGVQYVLSHLNPPPDYSQWTLSTPLPELSSGPYADILLCKRTESLRVRTQNTIIRVWQWPSCNVASQAAEQ